MINPASRTKTIELSLIRKMFEVANPDAINLGLGEPDFNVPENIKQAMISALIVPTYLVGMFVCMLYYDQFIVKSEV